MRKRFIQTVAVALIGVLAASPALVFAGAAPDTDGRYGTSMGPTPYDQEIRIHADTKSVTARRLDIVKFVTADGNAFYWRFDNERPDVFPLARIAPAGIAVPAGATVYVLPEIPIAP